MCFPTRDEILQVARGVLRELGVEETPSGPRAGLSRTLISEAEVRAARARGEKVLLVAPGTIVTPLAHDVASDYGVEIRLQGAADAAPARGAAPRQPGSPAPSQDRGAIALGADHGGFAAKEAIKQHLQSQGLRVEDVGTHSQDSCDYPDFAAEVARKVALGEASWGIVVDGAGIGSCMAANKVPGVLAATCHDERTAKNSREHNGANVLCLGSGTLSGGALLRVVDAWLGTPFGGGRHARRVDKIRAIEGSFLKS